MASAEASSFMTVPESLERALRKLLEREFGASGASDIVIHIGEDHEGDPIVIVEVKHSLVDEPIDVKEVIDADRAVRDLAWEKGERRFVLVDHIYDERQRVAGAP